MAINRFAHNLLNQFEVGISLLTWNPENPELMDWILINDARCRMSGFTREEILEKRPYAQTSRETRAIIKKTNVEILDKGFFSCESTMLHKSHKAIPVFLHMKLIQWNGEDVLLVEFHDISSFKETESMLKTARESSGEMLKLIERDKQNIIENIKGNLGMVLFPLMDQLRISANEHQHEVLDLMVKRIEQVGREIGITGQLGSSGFNLSKRQILICEMIRDGMTSKEIAGVLRCAPSTINNHRNIIRRKLKISGKSHNLQAFLNSPQGRNI